jgi:hypothetical protein
MKKKRYWIEAILTFLGSGFLVFIALGEAQEVIFRLSDRFPLKYLFWKFSKVHVLIPAVVVSSILFSFLLSKSIPFIKKSISTPFRYWCMYQGIFLGCGLSIFSWHILNYKLFQSAVLFRGDFIVLSIVIGIVIFISDSKTTLVQIENNSDALSEKPIKTHEQDLIKVDNIVDEISAAIESCLKTNRKLIAVYGPNGIGKTSAITLSLKKLDKTKVFVTEFEPYKYGSELEMIRSFFSQMLKPLDDRYILPGANTLSKKLTNILYGVSGKTPVIPFDFSKLVNFFSESPDFYNLKETIEQYLLNLNKQIVFLVDDIDRCSVRKRYIFFQLVNAIRSLTNVLIIISASADELLNNKEPEIISIVE